MKPFVIIIGGQELTGYTSATLRRSKSEMTGSLEVNIFLGYIPSEPVYTYAVASADVLVYVGGNLAFVGTVDRRLGAGKKKGAEGTDDSSPSEPSRNVSIGPDSYNIRLVCRGKTKMVVDSSHRHPTTNMLKPTNREAFESLLEGTDVELDWMAEVIKLDKVRFRDGNKILHEMQRLANENAHFIYETREGKIRVTDDTARAFGDSLILGQNIMEFNTSQGEDRSRKETKVKGQRSDKTIWGKKAIEDIEKTVTDNNSTNDAVVTVQHFGDGTPEALERRAKFEANKRTADSKNVTVDVFHVQSDSEPWDLGLLHYVEIPPEGICDVMECTELVYTVQSTEKLFTTLTLAPPPSSSDVSGLSELNQGLGFFTSLQEIMNLAQARKAALGIRVLPGQYPATWSGPDLSLVNTKKSLYTVTGSVLGGIIEKTPPPVKLPRTFL